MYQDAQQPCADCQVQATGVSLRHNPTCTFPYPYYNAYWDKIQSVSFVKYGDYYDLHVPGWEHYSAHGLWHHNSGKTRAGCVEVLRQPAGSVGMVLAPTYPMLRDATLRTFLDLVNRGGILKTWHKAEMTAELSDGKIVMFRSADNPDRLRGPNLGWFYLDEAAMMLHEVWLVMLGRLREAPGRAWATSTPRGMNWLQKLFMGGEGYAIVRSSTRDNPYLPAGFIESLEHTYTQRLLRQEVEGEFIDDVEGALWTRGQLDDLRVARHPDLVKVVVAVDPAVTSGEDSDETGIVVAGLGVDGHGYVLADRSGRYSPDAWARRAVAAFHEAEADRLVAEVNNGGDLIETVVRTVDRRIPYTAVHAARGKQPRASPVAALYEQGKVHHVGAFPQLEDQLCSWVPGDASPDRLDALVWAFTYLMVDQQPNRRLVSYGV
jgi:phage terminase large subunit-like protein